MDQVSRFYSYIQFNRTLKYIFGKKKTNNKKTTKITGHKAETAPVKKHQFFAHMYVPQFDFMSYNMII